MNSPHCRPEPRVNCRLAKIRRERGERILSLLDPAHRATIQLVSLGKARQPAPFRPEDACPVGKLKQIRTRPV